MGVAYLGLIVLTLLLLWSAKRHQPPPAEVLKRRLETQSRGAEPEMALVDGSAVTVRKWSTLAVIGVSVVGVESWVWKLIAPIFSATSWDANDYVVISRAALGGLVSIVTLVIAGIMVLELFMEVDGRGIHCIRWGGRDFIPWSSVTKVSIAVMGKATVLEVRANQKKVRLTMELFRNPAALVTLIRRHVPADRLKDI